MVRKGTPIPIRVLVSRSLHPDNDGHLVRTTDNSTFVRCDTHMPVALMRVELFDGGMLQYAAEIEESMRTACGEFLWRQLTDAQRAELSAAAYAYAEALQGFAAHFPIGCPLRLTARGLEIDDA